MTSAPAIFKLQCHYCSRWRLPSETLDIGQGGVRMCLQCHELHVAQMLALATGGVPPGCFDCRATWEELRLRLDPGDNTSEVKMFLTPKDGIYQLLCRTCSDAYELKRADLFKGTQYGQTKGIV